MNEQSFRNHPLHKAVTSFTTDAESVRTCSSLGSLTLLMIRTLVGNKYNDFLSKCEKVEGPTAAYKVPLDQLLKHNKLQSEFNRGLRATQIVPRSLLIALVSQYDAFLSSLLRGFFVLKPELINASQKTIEVAELFNLSSIEEAKQSVIDSEVESLLRESHQQQFQWIEKRFSIATLTAFPSWPKFIELTQRRNLFVHTDGRVSKQYLSVCKANGLETAPLKAGDQLEADSSYIRQSVDIMFEVAVKLTQVLWRKALPSEIDLADRSLVDITYELLERKRYNLAITLLDFAFETLKKFSTPDFELRMLINRANAYRLSGNATRSKTLIEAKDWSAYDPAFRMAAHILKGESAAALVCMKQIGTTGNVSKSDYREWPLFEGLRDEPAFRATFEQIFDEPFVTQDVITPTAGSAAANPELSLDMFAELDFESAQEPSFSLTKTEKPN